MQHIQQRSFTRPTSGFTLIELLVTVAIAAILLGLAAPSLQDVLQRSRMSSIGGQFGNHILRARTEAVSRNTCTIMCMSTNPTANIVVDGAGIITSGPRCINSGTDWQRGWIVFLKEDCVSDTTAPNSRPVRPADYLAIRESIGDSYNFQAQGGTPPTRIVFNANGRSGLGSAAQFDLSYVSASSAVTQKHGYNMCLDSIGRTRYIKWNESC